MPVFLRGRDRGQPGWVSNEGSCAGRVRTGHDRRRPCTGLASLRHVRVRPSASGRVARPIVASARSPAAGVSAPGSTASPGRQSLPRRRRRQRRLGRCTVSDGGPALLCGAVPIGGWTGPRRRHSRRRRLGRRRHPTRLRGPGRTCGCRRRLRLVRGRPSRAGLPLAAQCWSSCEKAARASPENQTKSTSGSGYRRDAGFGLACLLRQCCC